MHDVDTFTCFPTKCTYESYCIIKMSTLWIPVSFQYRRNGRIISILAFPISRSLDVVLGESQRRPHLHLQMVIITIPGTILSMYSFTGDWDLISLFDLNHVRSKFPYRFRALEIFCILFWIKLWNESLPFYNYFIFDTITETELNFFIFFFLLTLWIALGCKRFKVRFIILTKTLVF